MADNSLSPDSVGNTAPMKKSTVTKQMLDAGERVLQTLTSPAYPLRTIAREVYIVMSSVVRPIGRPPADEELKNQILSDLRSGFSVRQTMFRRKASLYMVNKIAREVRSLRSLLPLAGRHHPPGYQTAWHYRLQHGLLAGRPAGGQRL